MTPHKVVPRFFGNNNHITATFIKQNYTLAIYIQLKVMADKTNGNSFTKWCLTGQIIRSDVLTHLVKQLPTPAALYHTYSLSH